MLGRVYSGEIAGVYLFVTQCRQGGQFYIRCLLNDAYDYQFYVMPKLVKYSSVVCVPRVTAPVCMLACHASVITQNRGDSHREVLLLLKAL